MDIKKVQEIVENSQLTDEAKDLIFKMLPEADKPEVKEEIMAILDYEIEMNEALADEGEEILKVIDDGDKMAEAVEKVGDEQIEDLGKQADEKFAKLEEEKEDVEKEVNELSGSAVEDEPVQAPVQAEETVVQAPVAQPTVSPASPWQQAAPVQAPVQPVVPQAPQWNQPVVERPATSPAPFPGSQTGQM